ncbi:SDR family oxidoreductase [Tsukamurella sp. 1534]|uniref:SDR family oxidoreductase n=1 Tax=Tsukamurella sp. 1534 TaxID=1151061 RepID=UPI0002E65162|nr:SDR family oxidoreductase [Tsukamurella sp. 1534]
MSASPTAILTNVTEYAGPPGILALEDIGAKVYAHDKSFGDASARAAYEKDHPTATAVAGDRLTVAARAFQETGRIDVLVENSVGKGERHITDCEDPDELHAWLADAATEMIVEPSRLLNYVARVMRDQKSGAIVLFGSESWMKPQSGTVYYSAMRATAPSMALGAARDLGRYGVQVNCITPNYMESAEYYPPAVWDQPEKKKELAAIVPMGRLDTYREVANVVRFLIDGKTQFLTGSTIKIDGGALV